MCNRVNVLMTGAGAPGGPGILKALLKSSSINLHVADSNPLASGVLLHKNSHVIPNADEECFIKYMLTLCRKNKIDVLFPLVTKELFKLSKNKELFKKNGIKVLSSENEAMEILNDKAALLKHLSFMSIPHPSFLVVRSSEELEEAVFKLGYPDKTVVIKPSRGNGSRGIRILDPMVDQFDLLFHHKPNSLYSTLDFVLKSIEGKSIPEMIVSEYLPGEELTIDTVIANGEVIELLIRTRDSMRSGISTSGRFITNQKVDRYIRDIIGSFNYGSIEGAVGFQVKENINGDYLILESNPRIQGTSVAAIGCGVNLPVLAVMSALGREVRYQKLKGIGFCRYYDEVFYEY